MRSGPAVSTVDEYFAQIEREDFRLALQQLREVLRSELPEAQEVISYGMPSFKMRVSLVYYAAFKNHLSFFPAAMPDDLLSELNEFKVSKGTIQFQPEKPIPEELVRKLVRARLERENSRHQK